MNNISEALETGALVLGYIDKGMALMFFLACATATILAVQLVQARHILAAHGLL